MKQGIHFTEPLPSNDRRNTHTDTQTDVGGFMKYADEIDSGVMICIPSSVKTGPCILKLMGGRIHRHTDTHRAWISHKPAFIFSK
jgi:hypothetical protein